MDLTTLTNPIFWFKIYKNSVEEPDYECRYEHGQGRQIRRFDYNYDGQVKSIRLEVKHKPNNHPKGRDKTNIFFIGDGFEIENEFILMPSLPGGGFRTYSLVVSYKHMFEREQDPTEFRQYKAQFSGAHHWDFYQDNFMMIALQLEDK